jgi:hypothetical protein
MRELGCVKRDGQVNGSQTPGAVGVVLSGTPSDLIKAVIFLSQVTDGAAPADVLRVLHLSAIRITSESSRNHRVTLVLQLEEAAR